MSTRSKRRRQLPASRFAVADRELQLGGKPIATSSRCCRTSAFIIIVRDQIAGSSLNRTFRPIGRPAGAWRRRRATRRRAHSVHAGREQRVQQQSLDISTARPRSIPASTSVIDNGNFVSNRTAGDARRSSLAGLLISIAIDPCADIGDLLADVARCAPFPSRHHHRHTFSTRSRRVSHRQRQRYQTTAT